MDRLIGKVDACHSKLQTWSILSFSNICLFFTQKKKKKKGVSKSRGIVNGWGES